MPAFSAPVRTEPNTSGWHGRLEIELAQRGARTALVRRRHKGPYLVQSPFYPEGPVCHIYLLHPPGGVVGGDTLNLAVTAGPDSAALLTSPAAMKLYRSAGPIAAVTQIISVAPQASVEWLPQETLAFSGARAHLRTRVELSTHSRFIGWEALCLGRPANGEDFSAGRVRQDLEVWLDGHPLLIERNDIRAGESLAQKSFGLRGLSTLATLVVYPSEEHLERTAWQVAQANEGVQAAVSSIDGLLTCRIIAGNMRATKALLNNWWRSLRPLVLSREPCAPRIWAT